MKKRLIPFLFVCLLFSTGLYSQQEDATTVTPSKTREQSAFWKQVYWGGNLGLQLSNFGGMIDVSPNAGYKFNDFLSVGPQLIYTNLWARSGTVTYKYIFFGGGAFARVRVMQWLFLQAEYDLLSVPDLYNGTTAKRVLADVPLAGGGLRQQLGENSSYYFLMLYEFAPTPNSPYTNGPFASPLVYRFGFNVNF